MVTQSFNIVMGAVSVTNQLRHTPNRINSLEFDKARTNKKLDSTLNLFINHNCVQVVQFQTLVEQQKEQGIKIDKMYDFLINKK